MLRTSIAGVSALSHDTMLQIRLPLGSDGVAAERSGTAPPAEVTSSVAGSVDAALRRLPDADPPQNRPATAPTPATCATVLLAAPNADMRRYAGRIVENAGYQVQTVADGEAALAAARGPRRPEFVVADVMLPKLDGFGLLRALRADPHTADILVILLSAGAGPEARVEGLAAGVDEYIRKPFGAAELLARRDGAIRLDGMRRAATAREHTWRDEIALRQSRAELHESQEHHRYSIALSPQMPWTKAPDGKILDVSQRWLELTGLDREAALRLDWSRLLHPDDAARVDALWVRSIRTGEPYDVECRVRVADTSYRWIRSRAFARRDETGAVIRWYGTSEDVNDHVLADIHTRDVERRHALVFHSMTVGVWDWDMRAGTLYWSPRLKEMLGESIDFVPTREDFRARLHPDDRDRVRAMWDSHLDGSGPFVAEYRMRGPLGRYLWVNVTGQVECDDGGRPFHAVGSVDDITARKQAEERFRLLVEFSPLAKVVIDAQDRIVMVNRQTERLFGYDRRELLGQKMELLLPDRLREKRSGDPARSFASRGPTDPDTTAMNVTDDIFGRRKDGTEFPGEMVLVQIDVGDEPCVLSVITDATQLRLAAATARNFNATLEREVAERTAQLVAANKELDAFAYVASHDLKAPLRVISNVSKWLEEDLHDHLTDDTRENMALLRSRVTRMEKLLDDLLDYSRIGQAGGVHQSEAVSGDELREGLLGLLAIPASFAVNFSETFASIRVERMPLQQVMLNLISNAIKHHDKPAGRIDVTVEDRGDQYEFWVRDDGPGIAAEFHEQIFRLFQTLKPRDLVEGSGMGLAMVRKYVNSHNGRLALESSEGTGCRFSFTWPKPASNDGKG